jgi:phage terminase large subunit GpA-like protein
MLLANPERLALEVVASALEPPAEIDFLAFAEQHVTFDEGPFPGPYSRQLFPFFDEILRALGPRDPCRYVTMMSSAQVGKTTLAEIFCLGSITLGRGSFLFVHPTQENAVRFAKMKLLPMMRSMPVVNAAFPSPAPIARLT